MTALRLIVFCAGIAGVGLLLVQQFRQFRTAPELVSARLLGLRITSGVLLIALVGMMNFNKPLTTGKGPLFSLYYWTWFIVILFVLMGVTVLDLRELRRQLKERQEHALGEAMRRRSRDGGSDIE